MSVSLCVLRVEIDEELPEMGDNTPEAEATKDKKKHDRGARESKTITVETYASILSGPTNVAGILPATSCCSSEEHSSDDDNTISFFCGNPLMEVTKGILHLYKENELKEAGEAKTLCLLAVPGALGASDLLAFAAACQQDIAHVRVLRDGSIDHYMALLTFRTSKAAQEFHAAFDGVPYSSLEPNSLCHIAWVSRVESARHGTAPPSHTELPTCPVCLERMDESVAGVLSVQCAHAFHAECLVRWRDASCPVCRCAQTPEPRGHAVCAQCETEDENEGEEARENVSGVVEGLMMDEVESGSLWICLICGNVGCGRYERGHAAKHFMASNHTYALQLGSNRVWDYAGDNFVHRLVQNKADGKLVAAEGAGAALDKLEFSRQLQLQLDTQRNYYDNKIEKMESLHMEQCGQLAARVDSAEGEAAALQQRLHALQRDNRQLEKKLQHLTTKMATLQTELGTERELGGALARGHAAWQLQATERDAHAQAQIAELKDQLRDLMFFVEARGQLEQTAGATPDELAAASVTVAAPPKPRRRRR